MELPLFKTLSTPRNSNLEALCSKLQEHLTSSNVKVETTLNTLLLKLKGGVRGQRSLKLVQDLSHSTNANHKPGNTGIVLLFFAPRPVSVHKEREKSYKVIAEAVHEASEEFGE